MEKQVQLVILEAQGPRETQEARVLQAIQGLRETLGPLEQPGILVLPVLQVLPVPQETQEARVQLEILALREILGQPVLPGLQVILVQREPVLKL